MKLSFFRRRSWKKHLAVAVTAGILAGAYAPGVMAASGGYDNNGEIPETKVVDQDINIVVHSKNWSAQGINVGYVNPSLSNDASKRYVSTFNGNITMRDDTYAGGWGVTATDIHAALGGYKGARWEPAGIRASQSADVIINGDLDMAVYGSGLVTDPYYNSGGVGASITLNGNVNIETPTLATEAFYAVANYGGNITINESGTKDVILKGNIISFKNDNGNREPFFTDGVTNITLNNDKSSWSGVVDNSGSNQVGEINLTLANGANWYHESLSMTNGMQSVNMPSPSLYNYGIYNGVTYLNKLAGGANSAQTGYIYARDKAGINIADYSGYTTVFYEHLNSGVNASDYTAGDITIQKAASGSGITLVTTNNNVKEDQINLVLNALAGKLTYADYSNNPDNLDATVKIAGGLTADAVTVKAGSIVFADSGKGGYESKETTFNTTLTGDAEADAEYKVAGVLQKDGSYKFTQDSKIVVDGAAAVQANKAIEVDATGKDLTLQINNGLFGIAHSVAQEASITAAKVNVDVTGNSVKVIGAQNTSSEGRANLIINADTDISAHSTGSVHGIFANENADITINGNTNITIDAPNANSGWYLDSAAIRAYSANSNNPDASSTININGDLSIKTDILALYANGGGSTINLNGGVDITTTKKGQPVVLAEGGSVNINMSDKAEDNIVKIVGNVVSSASLANSPNKSAASDIKMQLLNKESAWEGVAYNSFPADGIDNGGHYTGSIELALANGATWNNHLVGEMYGVWNDYKVEYAGSHVNNFKGGASAAAAGNIFQNDKKNITIDNYSGVTNVFYANNANGDFSSLGDTIIKHAEENSAINLITTAPTNVTVDSITSVLNALAGKLTYAKYATANGSERNLTGTAKLAGGLTSNSVVLALGNIVFDEGTGKGTGVSGIEATSPDHQVTNEFANTLTGDVNSDLAYILGGVRQADGSYKFTEDSKIAVVASGAKAIDLQKSTIIDAANKTLTLSVTKATNYADVKAINITAPGEYQITADKIVIYANASDNTRVEGISASTYDVSSKINLTVNGDVDITNTNKNYYNLGIYAMGNTKVDVNGNVNVNLNSTATNYYETSGIYAGGSLNWSNKDNNRGSEVNINGDVNVSGNGNGVLASYAGSVANLNGNTTIVATDAGKMSVAAQSGTVNVNVVEGSAGDKTVKLTGNVGLIGGAVNPSETVKETTINLGLTNDKSFLTGVIYDGFTDGNKAAGYTANANIWLQNGAIWNNELASAVVSDEWGTYPEFAGSHVTSFKGGASAAAAGNIYQNDSNALTIDNYSGVTNVFYANDGATSGDFSAYGDTIIKHAETGSIVNLITNGDGSVAADVNVITNTLSALAGKLTYEAYAKNERNLIGTAKIAGGLTSDSVVVALGNIVFDKNTGKGTGVSGIDIAHKPDHQVATAINSTLTGDADKDLEYTLAGVLQKDGTYKFTENSKIAVTGENARTISLAKGATIDAFGKTLTLDIAESTKSAHGLYHNAAEAVNVKADTLNINIKSTSTGDDGAQGIRNMQGDIVLDTDVAIDVNGTSNTMGIYNKGNVTVNGDLNVKVEGNNGGYAQYGASGIYATSSMGSSKGGAVNVNGTYTFEGNANGIYANAGGSVVNVNGGSIKVAAGQTKGYAALIAEDATINMNVVNGEATNNKVNIEGNLIVSTGATNENDIHGEKSTINLGLTTADSTLHGAVYNAFPAEGVSKGEITFTGTANLWLQNGAVWTNEVVDTLTSVWGGASYAGSHITNLTGGTGSSVGYIYQKDGNALTIDQLSGNINITYDHTVDAETQALKFEAGKTVIGSAEAGSKVTMATAANGIDTADKAAVEAAFADLAQKLVYKDAATKPANLTADMTIGGGLTGNTASWKGNIEFTGTNGGYQAGSAEQAIDLLFDEDVVSKDTRAAIMSSMVGWRNAAADTYSYRHSARAPQGGGHGPVDSGTRLGANDEGVWARTWGGQNKYSGNNTSFKNSFWAGQVGYDKNLANGWNVGVAFDYMTSDESYNSGSGDSKTYTLGFYGSKEVAKNEFVDVTAKLGRFSNDFETKDILGRTVKGDYKATGFSVSGQYSKRFGNEAAGYFEPSAQLTIGRLGSSDFDSTGTLAGHISQDAFTSIVGTLGLEAGQASEHGRYFARLSLNHEFAGSMDTHFSDAYNSKTREFDLDGTWCDLTMGGTYELGDNLTFYGDVTKTLSGDYKHDWMINAGLRFTF